MKEFKSLVSVHLPTSWIEALRRTAETENIRRMDRVTVSHLIREALEHTYGFGNEGSLVANRSD